MKTILKTITTAALVAATSIAIAPQSARANPYDTHRNTIRSATIQLLIVEGYTSAAESLDESGLVRILADDESILEVYNKAGAYCQRLRNSGAKRPFSNHFNMMRSQFRQMAAVDSRLVDSDTKVQLLVLGSVIPGLGQVTRCSDMFTGE